MGNALASFGAQPPGGRNEHIRGLHQRGERSGGTTDRVERLPDASHWVHHDGAERVNQLLIDFFSPAQPAKNR